MAIPIIVVAGDIIRRIYAIIILTSVDNGSVIYDKIACPGLISNKASSLLLSTERKIKGCQFCRLVLYAMKTGSRQ